MNRAGVRRVVLLLAGAVACLRLVGDVGVHAAALPMAFAAAMPRTVLWAWEEPEDLSSVDAHRVGVAYLAETLLLGGSADGIRVETRHQPLIVPANAAVMPVVRVQTLPGFRDTPELREAVTALLVQAARRSNVRALQIDFDASESQRGFYDKVLRQLRSEMPQQMPLSITALASWCGSGSQSSWLAGLPVDEAVPMMFRLGGRSKPNDSKDGIVIAEARCRSSIGLSTDESWPVAHDAAPRRIYLFSRRPWQPVQIAAAAMLPAATRPAALRVREGADRRAINDTGLTHAQPDSNSTHEDIP